MLSLALRVSPHLILISFCLPCLCAAPLPAVGCHQCGDPRLGDFWAFALPLLLAYPLLLAILCFWLCNAKAKGKGKRQRKGKEKSAPLLPLPFAFCLLLLGIKPCWL